MKTITSTSEVAGMDAALVAAFCVTAKGMLPQSVLQRATLRWKSLLVERGVVDPRLLGSLRLVNDSKPRPASANDDSALLKFFNLLEGELLKFNDERNAKELARHQAANEGRTKGTAGNRLLGCMLEAKNQIRQTADCGAKWSKLEQSTGRLMNNVKLLSQDAVSNANTPHGASRTLLANVMGSFKSVVNQVQDLLMFMPLDYFNAIPHIVDCFLGDAFILELDRQQEYPLLKSVIGFLFKELFSIETDDGCDAATSLSTSSNLRVVLTLKSPDHFDRMMIYVQKMLSLADQDNEKGQEDLKRVKNLINDINRLKRSSHVGRYSSVGSNLAGSRTNLGGSRGNLGGSRKDLAKERGSRKDLGSLMDMVGDLATAEEELRTFLCELGRKEALNMFRCVTALAEELFDEKTLASMPFYLTSSNLDALANGEKLDTTKVGIVPEDYFSIPGAMQDNSSAASWQHFMALELEPWLKQVAGAAPRFTLNLLEPSPGLPAPQVRMPGVPGYRNPFMDMERVMWNVQDGLLRNENGEYCLYTPNDIVQTRGPKEHPLTEADGWVDGQLAKSSMDRPIHPSYIASCRRVNFPQLTHQTDCWNDLLYRSQPHAVTYETNISSRPGHIVIKHRQVRGDPPRNKSGKNIKSHLGNHWQQNYRR
ncbi:hypothetical protein GNI_088140 [Gregarina niphandrodes]|uniref:Uncharacterized protein n=1 Tax=Gregarina niphandrodes TaxID=110365 RepID=A0A023B5R8_GRENI|nr:hypothetical protein GNI_088140 [Gregarina niphandrodes]EZG62257.1 hypothetical protein GNI_088140 [Gregarina niphandrodes]|eukprot:XP_011130729.1 hypothetical protein GNI_088140 [Gregarina niphandrodes]